MTLIFNSAISFINASVISPFVQGDGFEENVLAQGILP